MRVFSDRAQNFLDLKSSKWGDFSVEELIPAERNGFHGEPNTEGQPELEELTIPDHEEEVHDVARHIDAETMDSVYGSVRNNSSRRHAGHNELRALKAVEKEVPPGLITGADPRTIDEWYDNFRKAGLTYQDHSGEQTQERLTTEGEFFVDEAYRFMHKIGDGEDDEAAEKALGNLYSSLSKRNNGQGTKLNGFLMMAETDESIPDLYGELGTSRRTAYNWANEWLEADKEPEDAEENIDLFEGDPSDRRLTDLGAAAYKMIGNQYQRMDAVSEMKAEVIHQIEAIETDRVPYIPGNTEMVEQYADEELVQKYMER